MGRVYMIGNLSSDLQTHQVNLIPMVFYEIVSVAQKDRVYNICSFKNLHFYMFRIGESCPIIFYQRSNIPSAHAGCHKPNTNLLSLAHPEHINTKTTNGSHKEENDKHLCISWHSVRLSQQGIHSLPELLSNMHTVLHVSNVSH